MGNREKLCPFDKEHCIRGRCAVWNQEFEMCSFAIMPARMPIKEAPKGDVSGLVKDLPVSSGLSGKYRDPLFD